MGCFLARGVPISPVVTPREYLDAVDHALDSLSHERERRGAAYDASSSRISLGAEPCGRSASSHRCSSGGPTTPPCTACSGSATSARGMLGSRCSISRRPSCCFGERRLGCVARRLRPRTPDRRLASTAGRGGAVMGCFLARGRPDLSRRDPAGIPRRGHPRARLALARARAPGGGVRRRPSRISWGPSRAGGLRLLIAARSGGPTTRRCTACSGSATSAREMRGSRCAISTIGPHAARAGDDARHLASSLAPHRVRGIHRPPCPHGGVRTTWPSRGHDPLPVRAESTAGLGYPPPDRASERASDLRTAARVRSPRLRICSAGGLAYSIWYWRSL